MCILNINRTTSGVFGNMRMNGNVYSNCVLGLMLDGDKFFRQNIVCGKNGVAEFKLSNNFDINRSIACIMVQEDKPYKAIMWGGNVRNVRSEILDRLSNNVGRMSATISAKKVKNVAKIENNAEYKETKNANMKKEQMEDSTGISLAEYGDEIVGEKSVNHAEGNINAIKDKIGENDSIDEKNNINQDVVDTAKVAGRVDVYKCRDTDDIAGVTALFEENDSEVEKTISATIASKGEPNFFEMISDQIDELFAKYPEESRLGAIVPNSKWVKVNFEEGSRTYVIGLIYDNETIKYVSYGVPGKKDDEVPDTIDDYYQWIPIDPNNLDGDGYFVMYQDAETGETIKL